MENCEKEAPNRAPHESCFACTLNLKCFIRSTLPVLAWAIYLCVGSLLFTAIENDGATRRRMKLLQLQLEYPQKLSNLTNFIGNNCMNANHHLKMVDDLSNKITELLEQADFGPNTRPWTFLASLKFCLTAVSTIGEKTSSKFCIVMFITV